jgi:hypothetical protein
MNDKKSKQPFYLIDTSADFYRPLGVRLTICITASCWAALEIWHKEGFWGVIAGAIALYSIYVLFVTYNPPPKPEPATRPDDPEDENGEIDGKL